MPPGSVAPWGGPRPPATEPRELVVGELYIGGDGRPLSNAIHTNKYRFWDFLPKNLYEQFHRLANWYFLGVIILNWAMNVVSKEAGTIPLAFVLVTTAVKDLYEDYRRRKADRAVNCRLCSRLLPTGEESPVQWREVHAGYVLCLRNNETIPADMLLLWSSSAGVCFVETSNLDGEANLKHRIPLLAAADHPVLTRTVRASLFFSPPDKRLESVNGTLMLKDEPPIHFDASNVLLRGCTIRNTEQVIGVVLYTGKETKAFLNSGVQVSKRSKLESRMNRHVLQLMGVLFAMCLVVAVGSGWWTAVNETYYLQITEKPEWTGFLGFWNGIIVFQVMVPISLYVMLEFIKLVQSGFIEQDAALYDAGSDKRCKVRALNIPEQLGQVGMVFSDKTGTLTDNLMLLRHVSVAGRDAIFDAGDPELAQPSGEKAHATDTAVVHRLLLALSTCNTVLIAPAPNPDPPSPEDDKEPPLRLGSASPSPPAVKSPPGLVYEAESPDELALVKGARTFGYTLGRRDLGAGRELVELDVAGTPLALEVAFKLPFDHVRKRMTVVLRLPDGEALALCKGADTSIAECLREGDRGGPHEEAMCRQTLHYSQSGLRTLWFAYRALTPEELRRCQDLLQAGIGKPDARPALVAEVCQIVETQMLPLGVTAIEDKLQEEVPQTIKMLRDAGLKVWVLTGDKTETAINIAVSCNLISEDMTQLVVEGDGADACLASINKCLQSASDGQPCAVVTDGAALMYALADHRAQFYRLVMRAGAVLCCRVSPDQKAEVVRLVKEHDPALITLAVGDGANDVAMLKAAHVGVGIAGREGIQAVLSSDFAIARFRMLQRLLLVHGHWAYDRIAYLVIYSLYKNVALCFLLLYFFFHSGFSAISVFDDLALVAVTAMYTILPSLVYSSFEQHLRAESLLKYPALYEWGRADKYYSHQQFWAYMGLLLYQTLVIFYVSYGVYIDNEYADFWGWGLIQLFAYVLVVTLQLLLDSRFITGWLMLSVAVSFAATLIIQFFVNLDTSASWYWAWMEKFTEGPLMYLCVLLQTVLAMLPIVVYRAHAVNFHPTLVDALRRQEARRHPRRREVPPDTFPPRKPSTAAPTTSRPALSASRQHLLHSNPDLQVCSVSTEGSSRSALYLLPAASPPPSQPHAREVSCAGR